MLQVLIFASNLKLFGIVNFFWKQLIYRSFGSLQYESLMNEFYFHSSNRISNCTCDTLSLELNFRFIFGKLLCCNNLLPIGKLGMLLTQFCFDLLFQS